MSGAPAKVLHAQEANAFQQPSKKLHFVVGRRGKHELLAIGGRSAPCSDPLQHQSSAYYAIAQDTCVKEAATDGGQVSILPSACKTSLVCSRQCSKSMPKASPWLLTAGQHLTLSLHNISHLHHVTMCKPHVKSKLLAIAAWSALNPQHAKSQHPASCNSVQHSDQGYMKNSDSCTGPSVQRTCILCVPQVELCNDTASCSKLRLICREQIPQCHFTPPCRFAAMLGACVADCCWLRELLWSPCRRLLQSLL